MKEITIYQLDAFSSDLFGGNPAAVCPLDTWLDDDLLQKIAAENNLSETAFFVEEGDGYRLRWFTPVVEVTLCGHATLATAQVVFDHIEPTAQRLVFESLSGALVVTRVGQELTLDFPALPPLHEAPDKNILAPLGQVPEQSYKIREVHGAPYVLAVYATEADVAALKPDFSHLQANVIATAPGENVDFVSRFFAPCSGIAEDPVTGSAHCTLMPYWAQRLGKSELRARQISKRGGDLLCRLEGERVLLTGRCAYYMRGEIRLP